MSRSYIYQDQILFDNHEGLNIKDICINMETTDTKIKSYQQLQQRNKNKKTEQNQT